MTAARSGSPRWPGPVVFLVIAALIMPLTLDKPLVVSAGAAAVAGLAGALVGVSVRRRRR